MCSLTDHPITGKTFLAGTVINKCQSLGNRTIYAFLSHVYATSTSALSILHSLVFQLASSTEDLQAALCQSDRGNLKTDLHSAISLLKSLLECAGATYLVIDGADEIEKAERRLLLPELVKLSEECDPVRILICSRAESDITRILGTLPSIRVDHCNSGTIQLFVNRQSSEWLASKDFLPQERSEVEALLAPVAFKADGKLLLQMKGAVLISNFVLGRHVPLCQGPP